MKLLIMAGLALGFTAPITAQNELPKFAFPVDCTLGENCWIARYMDRAEGQEKADYACKARTQNAHNGTDIVLSGTDAMDTGVAVKAGAAGRVIALREGVLDEQRTDSNRKRGCGNFLTIGHGNGWQTRYCHLKNDSLLVKKGDRVAAGQTIAEVGLSGLTEFPHLHFMVQRRQRGKKIQFFDPFDGGQYHDNACTRANPESTTGFWAEAPSYQSTALLPPVLSDKRRNRSTMWDPQPIVLPKTMPELFIQARGFHTLKGDEWRFSLIYPSGKTRRLKPFSQTADKQQIRSFVKLKQPNGGFIPGIWRATVELVRAGKTIGKQTTSVIVE